MAKDARIETCIRSERGASFFIALVLFFVCAVVTAVVLAGTMSSTRQGAATEVHDQRYYSVISAAQVFRESLTKSDGTPSAKYEIVQRKVGVDRSADSADSTESTSSSADSAKSQSSPVTESAFVRLNGETSDKGYNFLPDMTSYAISGMPQSSMSLDAALQNKKWNEWIEPFQNGVWEGGSSKVVAAPDVTYIVVPSLNGRNVPSGIDLAVDVTARLWSDWTLELEFANRTDNPDDRYFLYMQLSPDVTENGYVDKTADAAARTVTQTKTTTVVWHVDKIEPGRGLDNA